MKKVAFAVALIFAFGVGSAYADFLGIGRFWEDVKREATNAAHNTEKTIGKAWEDTKREATNLCKNNKKECAATAIGAMGAADVALGNPMGALKAIREIAEIL